MYQSCLEVRVPSCEDTHVLSCSTCQSPALSRAADGTSKRAGLRAHTDSLEPLFPPHDKANSHRTHELSSESLTLPHGGEGFIQPVRRGHPPQHRASVRTQRNLCLGPKPLPGSQTSAQVPATSDLHASPTVEFCSFYDLTQQHKFQFPLRTKMESERLH